MKKILSIIIAGAMLSPSVASAFTTTVAAFGPVALIPFQEQEALTTAGNEILSGILVQLQRNTFALDGGEVNKSVHADLIGLNGSVNAMRTSVNKQLENLMKQQQFYGEQAQLTPHRVLGGQFKDSSCQTYVSSNVSSSASEISKTSHTAAAVASKLVKARTDGTRDGYIDQAAALEAHDKLFCSDEDVAAGLCNKPCAQDDINCSVDADSSTAKFLSAQYMVYQNPAEQAGAIAQIAYSTDPYPNKVPDTDDVKDKQSADKYRYAKIVRENQIATARDILADLHGERVDIGGTTEGLKFYESIDKTDEQTWAVYISQAANASPANAQVSAANFYARWNIPGYLWAPNDTSSVDFPAPISKRKILEMAVASQYGNAKFTAKLGNSGTNFVALGEAMALNNKILLKVYDRLTQLVYMDAKSMGAEAMGAANPAAAAASAIERR